MLRTHRHFVWSVLLIFALIVSLLNVQVVLADDTTPPPPTEEPTEPPVEATETPTLEESSAAGDATASTEVPLPTEDQPLEEEVTVAEVLSDLPENTDVVVLDESGNQVPLASQEAAEAILEIDPMWCPEGVLPGGAGCSASFGTIDELRLDMISNTGAYSQNGVIYFTATAGAALNFQQSTLTPGDYNTLKAFNLTFHGGWNGSSASPQFSGQTSFAANRFQLGSSSNPWTGNITLRDITFSDANNTAVLIFTSSGDITLNNVDVSNQIGNNAAFLSSTSGDIIIQNNSVFDGDNFNGNGVNAATTSGAITISDSTFQQFKRSGGPISTWDGLTLSAPTVTLTNVTATDNDGDGISITNANIVTLNNVTSSNNGTELGVAGLTNNDGSGVVVSGLAGSNVYVFGGTFNNNQEYGVEIATPANTTLNIFTAPTCTGNDSNSPPTSSCYNVTTVVDIAPPVITFVSRLPAANGNGWNNTNVTVTWSCTDALSGVVSPIVTQTLSTQGASQSATGTCQDLAGNVASNTQTGINIDLTNPSLSLPANLTAEATGAAGASVAYSASASDNLDSFPTLNCAPLSGSTFAIATTTVNCSAADDAGNSVSGSFTVTVQDSTPPALTLPGNITAEATGAGGNVVTFSASASDLVDGATAVTCLPISGATFPIGATTVNCSASDARGNTASGSFTVTVVDTTPPSLTLPSNSTTEAAGSSGTTVNFTASGNDLVDGSVTVNCTPASGSTFGIGTTTVNCSAADVAGNSVSGSFTITVQDSTAPSLTLPGNITAEATGAAGSVVSFAASATDLVDGARTVTCLPASGSSFALGTTVVNCSVSDTRGNTASGSFTVTIEDTAAPTISAMADLFVKSLSSAPKIVGFSAPTTYDAVDGPGVATCTPAPGSLFPLGDTIVTCTATDSQGNTSSVTFTVHVSIVPTSTPAVFSSGGIILVTGGYLIDLNCASVVNAFGVLVKFHSLCDQQAVLNEITEDSLPGALPAGYAFVQGLDLEILADGRALDILPDNSGVEMHYPLPGGTEFAVLFWNGTAWVEITQPMNAGDLTNILATDAGSGLYKMSSSNGSSLNVLTTGTTGIFVLVTK